MKKILFLLIVATAFVSCDEIIRQNEIKQQQENYTNEFFGKYSGTFSGSSSGTISFDVSKSGNVTVVKTNSGGTSETFYGFVNDYGAFQNTVSPAAGFTLFGNLQTKSGTWKEGSSTGNWVVSKQ